MPRIARLVVKGEPAVYHVVSRTALDGFVLADVEKDYLLNLIKRLSSVYFGDHVRVFDRDRNVGKGRITSWLMLH